MAKNANLYVRVEPDIKTKAEQLFSSFGITVSDAINMFLYKAIMVGGIPFDVLTPKPNEETVAAILQRKASFSSENTTDFFTFSSSQAALSISIYIKATSSEKKKDPGLF